MTTKDKVARRKLFLLELAKELESVSRFSVEAGQEVADPLGFNMNNVAMFKCAIIHYNEPRSRFHPFEAARKAGVTRGRASGRTGLRCR